MIEMIGEGGITVVPTEMKEMINEGIGGRIGTRTLYRVPPARDRDLQVDAQDHQQGGQDLDLVHRLGEGHEPVRDTTCLCPRFL